MKEGEGGIVQKGEKIDNNKRLEKRQKNRKKSMYLFVKKKTD